MAKQRKFKRNEPAKAARWMLERLLKNQELSDRVNIKVYVRAMKTDSGRCYPLSSRNFIIILDSILTRNQSLSVLAHEIVHVSQYVTGRMNWNERRGVYWKQKKFFDPDFDETKLPYKEYLDLPWEKEARAKQTKLAESYIKHATEI